MTTPFCEGAPQPLATAAELASMDLEAQKAWALDMALQHARHDDVEELAEIAALLPSDSLEARTCYEHVAAGNRSNMFRVWAIRDLSLLSAPFADEAWEEAFTTATQTNRLDSLGYGAHRPDALEVIIEGQTDKGRIEAYKAHAFTRSGWTRTMMLAAVIKAEAASDYLQAFKTRQLFGLQRRNEDHFNAATLAIVEGAAREGVEGVAFDELLRLPDHLTPWGLLKIAKHMPGEDYDEHIDEPLKAHWEQYTHKQRLEILDDLQATGKLSLARDILFDEKPNRWTPVRHQRMHNILWLAETQAHTDLTAGHAILDRYEAEVIELANASIEAGMRKPISTHVEYSEEGFAHQLQHDDYLDALNRITMTRTALLVRQSVRNALIHHNRAAFYNDKGGYKDESRLVMASALADAGYMAEAAAEAMAISDDPVKRSEKVRSFIAIARAAHRRMGAAGSGQTAMMAIVA